MPFTVSHAAAVLPLHAWSKGRLPLSALMIGSMSPDFAYFVPIVGTRIVTHDIPGLFWFCMPAGIAVWWVFVRYLERPTLALIPEPWRAGLPPPTHRISLSLAVRAGIAVLLGAVTHVVWDSFTHAGTPMVAALPFLRDTIVPFGGIHLPLYQFLQYLSSALGLAALGFWVLRLRQPPARTRAPTHALPAVSTRTRVTAAATVLLASGALAIAYYTWCSGLRFESRLFYLLIGGMTGWALAWLGVAIWLNARWRATH